MKTVYKYALPITDEPKPILLPADAPIVLIEVQGGSLCMWVELDPEDTVVERFFCVHGTGHPIVDTRRHRGSTQMGSLVWHVYEVE